MSLGATKEPGAIAWLFRYTPQEESGRQKPYPLTLPNPVRKQEGLEGREGGGEGDGLFVAGEEGGEAGGELEVPADGAGDGFPELGGMGGFAEEAGFAFVEAVLEGTIAAGAVRIQEVAGFGQALADCGYDRSVAHDRAGDVLPDFRPLMAVQVQDAGEVTGITHVHRVREGADAGHRHIGARLQVVEEYVVAVVRGDEPMDGKAHPTGHERGAEVAEVSARDADHQLVSLAQARELRIAVEIVEGLRKEAGDIDAVGRCQTQRGAQVVIQERGLDQGLAVVEAAIDLQGCDVLPQGGELALLDRTDAALGIEDEDVRAGNAQEAVRDGAAGVAGRGDEDIDLALILREMPQETGHEARTDVLESEGRPMEEFQGVNPLLHRNRRAVEGKRFRDDPVQLGAGNILPEESARHLLRDLHEGELGHTLEPIGGKGRNPLRHIESAVFRQALDDGFFERGDRRPPFCAVVPHVNRRSGASPGWKP